ncbi:MAG TPA: hypothetical protein VIP70_06380 [Nitrososphaeraceae archaeon]
MLTKARRQSSSFVLLLLISGLVVIVVSSTLDTRPQAIGQQQTTTTATSAEKKDIFKVILTVDGLDHDSGDVATIVSVNGESRVKLFDDTKTYIQSINANSTDGSGGFIEYVATFPNATVKAGDEYKVCALLIKDSNLICETGNNSRALRPEFIDLHIQEEQPTATTEAIAATTEAAQTAATITDEEEEEEG